MIDWFKSLFCFHKWKIIRFGSGREIHEHNPNIIVAVYHYRDLQCEKCGYVKRKKFK